jgi:hypothetical protein
MKTSIKTLLGTGLIAIMVLSQSTVYAYNDGTQTGLSHSTVYANNGAPQKQKVVMARSVDVTSIQKIIVSGNVLVNIVQVPTSKVLYKNENNANVVVKKINNSLVINGGNAANGAEITVYVANIYRIDASGDAMVQTTGTLNLKNLQVFVKDNAKVEINSKTESLYTVIKDNAELKLQGHSDSHVLTMDKLSKITLENFSAVKTEKSNSDAISFAAMKK